MTRPKIGKGKRIYEYGGSKYELKEIEGNLYPPVDYECPTCGTHLIKSHSHSKSDYLTHLDVDTEWICVKCNKYYTAEEIEDDEED